MSTPLTTSDCTTQPCVPISSNCVVWQGPDIACINLCAGDTVTDVVYKLATELCQLIDTTGIDMESINSLCLLSDGATAPTTPEGLFQLIIDKLCYALTHLGSGSTPTTTYYTLPTCLQYTNGAGVLVTQVILSEYLSIVGNRICTILTTLTSLQSQINNLVTRVTTLENASPTTPVITVISSCADISGVGVTLTLQQAYTDLENSVCVLKEILGDNTSLQMLAATQCDNLSEQDQLSNPTALMKDLTGWTMDPTTVAENLTNLWLTVCDIRAKVIDCCNAAAVTPCALIAPTGLTRTTGSPDTTISWTPPATTGFEAPTSYTIAVYNWTGTEITGPPIYSNSFPAPASSTTVPTSLFTAGTAYAVEILPVYSCGSTSARLITTMLAGESYCVQVWDEEVFSDGTTTCSGTAYPNVTHHVSVRLINSVTGTPYNNPGSALSVEVGFRNQSACGTWGVDTFQTLTVPTGSSVATYTYTQTLKAFCSGTSSCGDQKKIYAGVNVANTSLGSFSLCPGVSLYAAS